MAKSFHSLSSGKPRLLPGGRVVWRPQLVLVVVTWAVTTMNMCLEPSSLPRAACWVHQRAQLAFAALTGKTSPFLTSITSFRGPVDIPKFYSHLGKVEDQWSNVLFFFEQLLFIITKRVPEVSIYPTHKEWLVYLSIYGNPFFRSYVQSSLTPRFGLQVTHYMSIWAYTPW